MTNDEIRRLRELQAKLEELEQQAEHEADSCRSAGIIGMTDYHDGTAKGLLLAAQELGELLDELTLAK